MATFESLPQDVFSVILQFLYLSDVLHLRQVCHWADTLISNDKQFWVHTLEDRLSVHGCHLPGSRASLDSLDAVVLESWVRRILTLYSTYTCTGAVTLSLLDSLPSVTWVKIVRGRWCLAAISNSTSSRLVLYDCLIGFESGLKAEVQLSGPVMDGLLEDTLSEINIAVSIGTTSPFIQIASLCTCHDGNVQIILRAVVPSASFTRFIQGRLVGFAMLDGDDLYPYVTDWTTGKTWSLNSELPGSDSPVEMFGGIFEQGICRGMTLWSNRIISVFGTLIKIFNKPDLECSKAPALIAALVLDLEHPVSEVHFMFTESLRHLDGRQTSPPASLFMIVRDTYSMFVVLELKADLTVNVNSGLTWQPSYETLLTSPRDEDVPYISCLGLTGSAFCFCSINSSNHFQIPKFRVALIWNSFLSDSETMREPAIVPTNGFPLLHEYPCVDFDDARGIALIGNCKGELALVEFEGGGVSERRGIIDDLPRLSSETSSKVMQAPVADLDLGLYYKWHFRTPLPRPYTGKSNIEVPDYIVDDYIKNNCIAHTNWTPPSGWSYDWRCFKYLNQWLVPYLFWGNSDTMSLRRPITRRLRNAYHIYGCPIPLLYHEGYHYVIFRIGSRCYLVKFEAQEDGIIDSIGRIHLSQEQILSGQVPNQLIHNYTTQELIAFGDSKAIRLLGIHGNAISALLKFSREAGLVDKDEHCNHWSQDKWNYLNGLRKNYLKCTHDRRGDYGEILKRWLENNMVTKSPGL